MRLTKKLKLQLLSLVKDYGYWSEEVKVFNSRLPYDLMVKLNNSIHSTLK